jgi:hypothetical protein
MAQQFCRVLLIIMLSILCSCSATRLTGTWVSPDYRGKRFHRILVLGVCKNETYLRIFEDSMSRELRKRGVQAEPGYALFPTAKRPDKETVVKEISGQGFDALIISQITGKRTEEVVHPGYTYSLGPPPFYEPPFYYRHWYDYYSRSYDIVHEPPYVTTYKVVTAQSNIYDTATDELVWSAITETVIDRKVEDLIDSLVNTLIKGMAEKGLI